ncbi:hypothetical protein J0A67_12380 [Algoriphagus aestuariicola]|jgi:hypothetical protein|uniref:Uncharacterized protein n=1 Tax=Algoriphagus aestuariicola TaxID=1852016 RepID=A0ABS3BS44_9BACT|nr:hypothetical protein [Algoriphagus aestuariicola]MBN7801664.1 hypothetical protein [Algoriphagus aestuariicola]
MKVRIRVVRAVSSPEETEKYIAGHFNVLESYGVTKVTSADRSWVKNPNVYLLLVESMDGTGRILGGGRIQMRNENFPLPLEGAILEKDVRIIEYMKKFKDLEVAEYCGLWNSKEVSGFGLGSIYLIRIGVAITSFLSLKSLMAFCSPFTVKNSQSVGFEIIETLGDNGAFLYPKEGLVATIMEIQDVINLPCSSPAEKEYIDNLRNNPVQVSLDESPKGPLEIHFDLNIDDLTLR